MTITVRPAVHRDVTRLTEMYTGLVREQRALRSIWPSVDGLAEPVADAFAHLIEGEDSTALIGEIDGAALGMLVGTVEALLPPNEGRRIGTIRLIYVDPEARGVGVGGVMLDAALDGYDRAGIDLFDAPVSPGHRLAKNFFESNGFKARSIIMHREGHPAATPPEDRP